MIRCVAVLMTFTACVATGQSDDSAFGRKPNIILVMTDDQGYFDLSCHGHPFHSYLIRTVG